VLSRDPAYMWLPAPPLPVSDPPPPPAEPPCDEVPAWVDGPVMDDPIPFEHEPSSSNAKARTAACHVMGVPPAPGVRRGPAGSPSSSPILEWPEAVVRDKGAVTILELAEEASSREGIDPPSPKLPTSSVLAKRPNPGGLGRTPSFPYSEEMPGP